MIAIHPILSQGELATLWRTLADVARHSFFLSWPWMRTWLACLPRSIEPHLLTISQEGMAIAAAILVKSTQRRSGFVTSRTWALNATGDPQLDQIFIENNGLLAREGYDESAWEQWARSFVDEQEDWDEISLRGVPPAVLRAWNHPHLCVREEMSLTSRFVDLERVRISGRPFTAMLGKKTRAHVRQTAKSLQQLGPVEIDVAADRSEALSYFGELKLLHMRRWNEGGAFAYPFFETFHTSLIANHFGDGAIQLLRVRVGDHTLGVLYNFLHGGDVVVYQTGFNYRLVTSPNRESPGLLTHALAIEFNAAQGHGRYDLLAGDSEYKRALAKNTERLWWGTIQRDHLRFRAEARLKRAWHNLSGRDI